MKRIMALLLALTLSGCLGDVPTSGSIQYGRENSDQGQENFVRAIVSPPVPGADPVGIVRGFMAAIAADEEDFKTARLFLTDRALRSWDPSGDTAIVDDRSVSWEYDNLRSPGSVIFRANQVGTLTSQGQLLPDQQPTLNQYRLVLVNKEWRIDALPQGVLITQTDLDRTYREVRLFYPGPDLQLLIPTNVYVPIRPGLATSLVRALLNGPTGWLAPALTTAFPRGTALVSDSVPIVDGIATIDLNAAAATAPSNRRTVMAAQLAYTLRQIREFKGLRLRAAGSEIPVSPNSWPSFSLSKPNSDPILSFTNDRGLAWMRARVGAVPFSFTSTTTDSIKGFSAPVMTSSQSTLLVADATGGLATGNTSKSGSGWQITGLTTVLQPLGRLSTPQWDYNGQYWVADRGAAWRLWSGRAAEVPRRVLTPNLGNVEAFAIARDGIRLIVSVREGAVSRIALLRVVQESGRVRVEGLRYIWNSNDSVTAICASGGESVSLLVGKRRIVTLNLNDGAVLSSISAPASLALTAAPSTPFVIESEDHRILMWRTGKWVLLTTGRDPSFAG